MPKIRNNYNARTDEFWQKIADDYQEYVATHDGATRGVVISLARLHGVSRNTMYTWIKWARRYEFLEPYSHRICVACRQPVSRDERGKIIIMEMNAGDYEEYCSENDLPTAAGHFRRAAEALARSETIRG